MSGVTDMDSYRQALNLSYHESDGSNDTSSCDAEDDSKTTVMLVSLRFSGPGAVCVCACMRVCVCVRACVCVCVECRV